MQVMLNVPDNLKGQKPCYRPYHCILYHIEIQDDIIKVLSLAQHSRQQVRPALCFAKGGSIYRSLLLSPLCGSAL